MAMSDFGAPSEPRILVVGCGGIGGILAAHLVDQRHDTTILTTNPIIADAVNGRGITVRGEPGLGTVRARAVTRLTSPPSGASGMSRAFDFVLLATQPPQVEEAARTALPFLAETGAMVCFQNGLCEERIARIAGADRVLGAIVAWGASMLDPGVYERTSSGGFVLGRLYGASSAPGYGGASPPSFGSARDPRLDALSVLLEPIGATTQSDNLAGARWSKLALNCAISALGTIGGERLGTLVTHRHVRRLALEIMTEVVEVARASGVRLEKVAGTLDLEWIALTAADRATTTGSAGLVAKHALLLAVGARYRRLRSSMLAAIERGRPPAIDFLNGEIVTRGAALGIPTPVNTAVRDRVWAIAAGRARPGMALLRGLFDDTRTAPPSGVPSIRSSDPIATPVVPSMMGAFAAVEDGAPGPLAMSAPLPADGAAPIDEASMAEALVPIEEAAPAPPVEPISDAPAPPDPGRGVPSAD